MDITLTDGALEEVKRIIKKDDHTKSFVRLSVSGGGCSGLSYKIDLDHEIKENDKVFEQDGVKIAVDGKSYFYLKDSVLDFTKGMMGSGFNFSNPNAKGTCGCGASFNV